MQAMAGFGLSKWCPAVAAASDRLNRERECVAEVGDPRLSGSSTLHSREHPVSRAGHPQAGRLISELAWATLRDLSVLIKSKETSSRELVAEHLDNVEAMNPAVNAIVTLDVERSLAEAAYADELLASGTHFGPLHGIPAAFSDAHETARMRTTFGSPLYKHHVSDHDDITVARMRSAGAIIIGKTNVAEFTTGCNTFNPLFGATRNPYNLGRTAGYDVLETLRPRLAPFESLGCIVEEASIDFDGADAAFRTLRAWTFAYTLNDLNRQHRDQLGPSLVWSIEEGHFLTGRDIGAAIESHAVVYQNAREFFETYDVLLTPAAQVVPFDIDLEYPMVIAGNSSSIPAWDLPTPPNVPQTVIGERPGGHTRRSRRPCCGAPWSRPRNRSTRKNEHCSLHSRSRRPHEA